MSSSDIIKLIEADEWDKLYSMIKQNAIKKPNELLINGNSLLHMACIKTKTKFVEDVFELCFSDSDIDSNSNSNKCSINPHQQNKDGYAALNLYYKYGGTSKKLLKLSAVCYVDQAYDSLLSNLMHNIDLMEIYIDTTIKKACLIDITITKSRIDLLYQELIKKINKLNSDERPDTQLIQRYLRILETLMRNITDRYVVEYAITFKSKAVLDYLMQKNIFNPLPLDESMSPLSIAVEDSNIQMVRQIINYYGKYVESNISGTSTLDVPNILVYISGYHRTRWYDSSIDICIDNRSHDILELLISVMEEYRAKHKDDTYHKESDKTNSTSLHNFLLSISAEEIELDKSKQLIRILSYLIRYTDLNQPNYEGYTSAQIFFKKGFWLSKQLNAESLLKSRRIDLVTPDPDGLNIYSYIEPQHNDRFMKLVKNIILVTNNKAGSDDQDMNIMSTIIDVVTKENISKKEFGLFGRDPATHLLYVSYLQNKNPNLFIPSRQFDKTKQYDDIYLTQMSFFLLSEFHNKIMRLVQWFLSSFYSYAPYAIFWSNKYTYYVNPDLISVLKTGPTIDQRFVAMYIHIISAGSVHANSVVYDRQKKEAWRFESYGFTYTTPDAEHMDDLIKSILIEAYGDIKYYAPSDYLSNLKFQLVGEEGTMLKNLGDPEGYCLAWSLWFIDVISSNIGQKGNSYTVEQLMNSYITRKKVIELFSDKPDKSDSQDTDSQDTNSQDTHDTHGTQDTNSQDMHDTHDIQNIYLKYIRQYARLLDSEKNKILKKLGVPKSDYYSTTMKKENYSKVLEYLKK